MPRESIISLSCFIALMNKSTTIDTEENACLRTDNPSPSTLFIADVKLFIIFVTKSSNPLVAILSFSFSIALSKSLNAFSAVP